jgi:hypothetical protein
VEGLRDGCSAEPRQPSCSALCKNGLWNRMGFLLPPRSSRSVRPSSRPSVCLSVCLSVSIKLQDMHDFVSKGHFLAADMIIKSQFQDFLRKALGLEVSLWTIVLGLEASLWALGCPFASAAICTKRGFHSLIT